MPFNTWAQKNKGTCFVSHLKSQVLKVHDSDLRSKVAEDWLKRNIPFCTSAQLQAIQSNSPSWLGTALTTEISSLIEVSIEVSISGDKEAMEKLYGSLGKEATSSTVTYVNPIARNPVVQVPLVTGPISGSVNYGNIKGDTIVTKNTTNLSLENKNANSNQNINDNSNLNGNGNTNIGANSNVGGAVAGRDNPNRNLVAGSITSGNVGRNSNINNNANVNINTNVNNNTNVNANASSQRQN